LRDLSIDNPIGVMQGRLLPKYLGRYQAHPFGYWQDEFSLASNLGLDCIEFILDFENAESNPLLLVPGRKSIMELVNETGVQVLSVCADYFMEAPLHSQNKNEALNSSEMLNKLIDVCPEMGIKNIVVPCVDKSRLSNVQDQFRLIDSLQKSTERAASNAVKLALETDLGPNDFRSLLQNVNCSSVSVNYDMGNSASNGFDPVTEFAAYGEMISDVHVKDRIFQGGSVMLGEGDTQPVLILKMLNELNYTGPIIMQVFRDDDGIASFLPQYEAFQSYLKDCK
jgi:L-ribulose-5-phosphate 3-epimerase